LVALLTLFALQAVLVGKYFGFMVGKAPLNKPTDNANFSPPVAVILCLRGDDPSLSSCLNSLFAQDYPNFEIHFVIDSKRDPAINRLENFLSENANRNVKTKKIFLNDGSNSSEIIASCSLKNQALIAAISAADKSIEVFALIDADGVVEENWLSELTAPLADEKVGASTGSRWFSPEQRNAGSIVRQTWNAAALPQMNFYNIPWGGALAIRRSVITGVRGYAKTRCCPGSLAKTIFK